MSATHLPQRTGMLWQQRIQSMREYEIVRDGNAFCTNFSSSFVLSSEYEEARRFLESLLTQYEGMSFNSVFDGREVVNDGGTCVVQKSRHALSHRPVDTGRFRDEITQDLTLVHGKECSLDRKSVV